MLSSTNYSPDCWTVNIALSIAVSPSNRARNLVLLPRCSGTDVAIQTIRSQYNVPILRYGGRWTAIPIHGPTSSSGLSALVARRTQSGEKLDGNMYRMIGWLVSVVSTEILAAARTRLFSSNHKPHFVPSKTTPTPAFPHLRTAGLAWDAFHSFHCTRKCSN